MGHRGTVNPFYVFNLIIKSMEEKDQLRKIIRQRKSLYTSAQLRMMSEQILHILRDHPKVNLAQKILLYYSLPDEVNTHDFVEELYQEGKTILLPKVLPDHMMEVRLYEGRQSLKEGTFHIFEPVGPKFLQVNSIDLAIIPGVSFDAHGHRLGRGKGYYDRFLATIPHVYKLGVCFDFQKVEKIPCEPTDIVMDELL